MRNNLFLTLIVLSVVVLGAAALFALSSQPDARLIRASPTDIEALARAIARSEDHVTPRQLADWLVADRKDLMLLDIRPAAQFQQQQIQTAQNIPLPALLNKETLSDLPQDRLIVVYAQGTDQAA